MSAEGRGLHYLLFAVEIDPLFSKEDLEEIAELKTKTLEAQLAHIYIHD